MTALDAATPSRPRFDLVDGARGLALLAMFVFHFAYDLSLFGLIETDVASDPGWSAFARLIAGSFLAITGFSLVLAMQAGLDWRRHLGRVGRIAAAAALVSLVTAFALPQNAVVFGILHHIALASLLALPFLRLPAGACLLAAVAVAALALIDWPAWLDHWPLVWTGLTDLPLRSADFVPLVPWFGCVLAGLALGKIALARGHLWQGWRPRGRPARALAWMGRRSLLIYLVHQPVFIATLWLATQSLPQLQERPFLLSCQRQCTAGATAADACERLCACTADALRRENLWRDTLAGTLTREQSARLPELAKACLRRP